MKVNNITILILAIVPLVLLLNIDAVAGGERQYLNVTNERSVIKDYRSNSNKEQVKINGVNSESLQIKAIIWEDMVIKNKMFHFTILVRNIGKYSIDVPNNIHGYGFNWTIGKGDREGVHSCLGNAGGPTGSVRLARGDILTYTLALSVDDSGEGDFEVFFNNTVQEVRLKYGKLKVEDAVSDRHPNP